MGDFDSFVILSVFAYLIFKVIESLSGKPDLDGIESQLKSINYELIALNKKLKDLLLYEQKRDEKLHNKIINEEQDDDARY